MSRPPHPIPPWSSPGQAFTPAVPALILHPEELTAKLTPPPSARPLLPQTHRFVSLAEPGTGHAPDRLKSHPWSPRPPGASLPEAPAPRDGCGRGEDSSFDGADSAARPRLRGSQPGMQTDVGRVPCRPQDASPPCSAALPASSSQQKVVPGPPSPQKCLTPGAPGSLPQRWRPWETPECLPKGKCPPPAPEVSSVTPALPGTPLSP